MVYWPVEVKGYRVGSNAGRKHVLELVKCDRAWLVTLQQIRDNSPKFSNYADPHVKILKGHPIVRIGSLQQRLKHRKVRPWHQTTFGGICNTEQNRELRTTNFRQVSCWCNSIDEIISVQEPLPPQPRVNNQSATREPNNEKRTFRRLWWLSHSRRISASIASVRFLELRLHCGRCSRQMTW